MVAILFILGVALCPFTPRIIGSSAYIGILTALENRMGSDLYLGIWIGCIVLSLVLYFSHIIYCKACGQRLGNRWNHETSCPRCQSNRYTNRDIL